MGEVIEFAKAKADADKDRSDHFASLHLYMNSDNSELWAEVDNVGEQNVDAGWHRFMADQLRCLAWLCDGIAEDRDNGGKAAIASINIFEDSRISTRWNEELIQTPEQIEWIKEHVLSGVDEISVD